MLIYHKTPIVNMKYLYISKYKIDTETLNNSVFTIFNQEFNLQIYTINMNY